MALGEKEVQVSAYVTSQGLGWSRTGGWDKPANLVVLSGGERDIGESAKTDFEFFTDMVSEPPSNDTQKVKTFIAGGDNG